ncbi:MAG: anhydro-N-acetylmuramic acid kinase [Ekhidna sp.]|nr:anhydro-N-acetylmuramic acid kinase [Ekhidna sp.]
MKTTYSVLGVMAGSSMDGLDIALVSFRKGKNWSFQIKNHKTIPYENQLYLRLKESPDTSYEHQRALDIDFGKWTGIKINKFIEGRAVDLISVHGHTLVHSPKNKISRQLGDGKTIAEVTNIQTVTSFRSEDIQKGGQGAPLVPLGDFELFLDFEACLNLGGIANISIRDEKSAWDICPCNQILNYYASKLGKAYDNEGQLAEKGKLDHEFVNKILKMPYFHLSPPKSLPNAFIKHSFLDLIDPRDGLRSYSEFIANQISADLKPYRNGKLLVTGGGGFNNFLVSRIQKSLPDWKVVIPHTSIIAYKEALIFAFLGLKRILGEVNVLRSVTGAVSDSSSGTIHHPE